jgi:hypothetical protein
MVGIQLMTYCRDSVKDLQLLLFHFRVIVVHKERHRVDLHKTIRKMVVASDSAASIPSPQQPQQLLSA